MKSSIFKFMVWPAVAIGSLTFIVLSFLETPYTDNSLNIRIDSIVKASNQIELSCANVKASHPLVFLALGQSNAGNHGELNSVRAGPVTLIADGKCLLATDPLPGATGVGGSIWQHLPREFIVSASPRPVALAVVAVDASTIDDWTDPSSPLKMRLIAQIDVMTRLGLSPNLVLWQQGEADALKGISTERYAKSLKKLAVIFDETGIYAPIMLAKSTICRSLPNTGIRTAVELTTKNDHRFREGPDTDILSGSLFRVGCHLTNNGLERAAEMWSTSIEQALIMNNSNNKIPFSGS